MSTKKTDFLHSQEREPHRDRTKAILKKHPEVRHLIGKNPGTFFYILLIVFLQFAVAYFLKESPWWVIIVTAYLVGAFADHALFVMVHECAHNLLFKKKSLNTLAGIFANLPQFFPSSVSFQRYHIKHHSFQGVHELDADLPNRWEAKLINNYFIGKAMWLLLFPFFQIARTFRLKEINLFDKWIALNWVVQVAFNLSVLLLLGPKVLVYFALSLFFSVGLHPLGARWIQEHYLTRGEQETYSYYGVLNLISFNVGYHNEHHDFPSIPWNKLPQIKSTAGDWYNSLYYHTSWTKLFFRFLFDQELSLFSRIVRKNRGNVDLADESKPDVELLFSEKK